MDPIIFQGTVDQLEDAADYVPILSALENRRTNQTFFLIETPLLLLGAAANFVRGRPDQAILLAALVILIGIVVWRRITGAAAAAAIASNRRIRKRGQERGRYDGNARFRLELTQDELRLYEQDGRLKEAFDCRLFHNATECEEVIWITGWRTASVALPKELLVQGTADDLHTCLDPHIKKWKTVEVPQKWIKILPRKVEYK